MTFDPPVSCPVCQETLELDRQLEDHLVGKHTQREVAAYVVSQDRHAGATRTEPRAQPNRS